MARKIETAMLNAIKANRAVHLANTAVLVDAGNLVVTLHGNSIARRTGTQWSWSLAGWNTPTTRSRVNAIAREFGLYRVTTKGGCAHAIRQDHSQFPIRDDEWVQQ